MMKQDAIRRSINAPIAMDATERSLRNRVVGARTGMDATERSLRDRMNGLVNGTSLTMNEALVRQGTNNTTLPNIGNSNKGTGNSGPTVLTGGGGLYGGGSYGTAASSSAPKYPDMPSNQGLRDILGQMQSLYDMYGQLAYEYAPMYFNFGNFTPDEQKYLQEARKRMAYETAARQPIWQEQKDATIRNYRAAVEAANAEQKLQQAAVRQAADAEAGRLANMMANTGMMAGQGALQEKFGVDQAFANQSNAIASQYGMQRAQAALEKANQLGGIGAERASYLGGLEGQIRDIADQRAAEAYNQWQNERAFQYQNFGDTEARRYQQYTDAYTALQNKLNSQLGILQNMAGLTQDERDFLSAWLTNKYAAEYGSYQDARNFGATREDVGQAQRNWNAEFGWNKTQEQEANKLALAELRLMANEYGVSDAQLKAWGII